MPQTIGAMALRKNLSRILKETSAHGESFIVRRGREAVAALVPVADFENWRREREESFSVLDEIHAKMPDLPEEEVEADIAAAIAEVRAARRRERERRRC